MADKNNTSSLLEAIKNKLSKFDNKPKPESKKSPVNYFSQDLPDAEIDKSSVDKTNIGLIFEAEKKLENIRKKNLNQNINKQKDIDLDLDDESLNVKDLGQKISIESKIKEIADELNLEEFEDDFEDDFDNNETQKYEDKVAEQDRKDIDPIDIELMELEKEIALNNQQKTQNNTDDQIAEDLSLKTYLDSKFEDEFEKIEAEIKKEQNIQELNSSTDKSASILQNNEDLNNFNTINFNQTQNQILLKITPAQDFLNKKAEGNIEENAEEIIEEKIEEIIEEKAEEVAPIQSFSDKEVDENIVENKNIADQSIEKIEEKIDQDFASKALIENKIEEKVEEKIEEKIEEEIEEKVEEKIEEKLEEKIEEKIDQNFAVKSSVENKIEENYFEKGQSQKIENQNIENKKQQQNPINLNNQEPIKSNDEIIEKNNLILEKINYNLIHEETIYQASNSLKKLMEAKNLVNNIGNFARDETLTKIAVNLMEPKLEKWLNENLPLMVENIIREEIEKIVPKG